MSLRTWWESRAESTPSDYTSLRIADATARVSGEPGVRGTGVFQACRGLIGRSTAAATLTGEFSESLGPHLSEIARALVDCGESTWEIRLAADGLTMIPCSIATVYGASDPKAWRYLLTRHGPTETASIEREAAGVLSFRMNAPSSTPWRGSSVLAAASGTGELLAKLEKQLAREASVSPARVIAGGAVAGQAKDISELVGAGGVVGITQAIASRDDPSGIKAGIVRNETSAPSVALYEQLERAICGALGVPAGLILSDGDGAAARENFRFFSASTIAPILAVVQTEWQAKIAPISYSLDQLKASDLTARSRSVGQRANAFKSLVAGGVGVERALEIVGLNE